MLSICTAALCGRTAYAGSPSRRPEGDWVERLDDDRLLQRRVADRGPVPVLRPPALAVPGAAARAPRRGGGDRVRRGDRGLPRHRHVLVLQLGGGPVRDVPGPPRGR